MNPAEAWAWTEVVGCCIVNRSERLLQYRVLLAAGQERGCSGFVQGLRQGVSVVGCTLFRFVLPDGAEHARLYACGGVAQSSRGLSWVFFRARSSRSAFEVGASFVCEELYAYSRRLHLQVS